MCTIAAIDSDMGWYYLSCKVCSKKVVQVPNDTLDDGEDENELMFNYYCNKCKCYNPKLLPRLYIYEFLSYIVSLSLYLLLHFFICRYKLHLVVLDNTGNSKFFLFDNLALQLLHQPCIELTGPISDEVLNLELNPFFIYMH